MFETTLCVECPVTVMPHTDPGFMQGEQGWGSEARDVEGLQSIDSKNSRAAQSNFI